MCCFPLLFLVYLCDSHFSIFFFFNDPATTEIYTLSLHDALLIAVLRSAPSTFCPLPVCRRYMRAASVPSARSEEHTSELQSPYDLVCRLLLEKKNKQKCITTTSKVNPLISAPSLPLDTCHDATYI